VANGWLRRPDISAFSLASYRRELGAEALLPACYALLEGGFVGVVADKVFQLGPFGIALISASQLFGNLASAGWAWLGERTRKVPLINALQFGVAALCAAIALIPATSAGGQLFVAALIATHVVRGGIVTLRSVIWTQNYDGGVRARVTARLTFLGQGVLALAALAAGEWLDRSGLSFREPYLLGALLGGAGALAFSGIAMRGEEARSAPPLGSERARGPRGSVFAVLREDPHYARYLVWQSILGASNMMIEPAVVILVSRELAASTAMSVALITAIPVGLGVLLLPLWAALVDRMHVAEFRAKHSWLWAISQAATGVGALLDSLAWVAAGRILLGIARGGGTLAWNIGHNDFAKPERAGAYMGLHATLTGLRGAIAPFVGIALYAGVSASDLPGGISLPALPAIGGWMMILAAALSAISTLGFAALHRTIVADRNNRVKTDG
jgi:MFS family permease